MTDERTPHQDGPVEAGADLAAVEREFSLLLRRARASAGELSREVHPELDGSAYALLQAVVSGGALRAQDVAAQFGVDKGAISRQVARLERLGLVERQPDPKDGRARVLVPTAAGRERFATASARRTTRFRARLAEWPREDVAQLASLLARLNATFDARPEDRRTAVRLSATTSCSAPTPEDRG